MSAITPTKKRSADVAFDVTTDESGVDIITEQIQQPTDAAPSAVVNTPKRRAMIKAQEIVIYPLTQAEKERDVPDEEKNWYVFDASKISATPSKPVTGKKTFGSLYFVSNAINGYSGVNFLYQTPMMFIGGGVRSSVDEHGKISKYVYMSAPLGWKEMHNIMQFQEFLKAIKSRFVDIINENEWYKGASLQTIADSLSSFAFEEQENLEDPEKGPYAPSLRLLVEDTRDHNKTKYFKADGDNTFPCSELDIPQVCRGIAIVNIRWMFKRKVDGRFKFTVNQKLNSLKIWPCTFSGVEEETDNEGNATCGIIE